jgi:hypothetical protein
VTERPPLTGQEIALAANATRALLDALLAELGTSFHSWVILNFAGTAGGSAKRGAVVARMRSALKIDAASAETAVDELLSLGLAAADGEALVLTEEGTSRFEQIRAGSGAIVDRLYTGLPVDDQLTTRRILETVTERANAELAGSAAPKTTTRGA